MKPIARPFAPTLLAAAIALATGCPSPEPGEKFDRFLDDTEEERESNAVDQGGALADINGTFLFALASFLAPTTPLQFFTTVTFTDNGDGTGTAELSMQPLSVDIGSDSVPRLPVGDPLEMDPVPIDANGAFVIDVMDMVMLPGEANPITGSPIITTRLTITGNVQDTDLFCGVVTGMVIAPLETPLDGSTFAAERVEDIAVLPVPPVGKCPMGAGGDDSGGSGGSESGSGSGTGG